MRIYNFKLNKSKIFKAFFLICALVCILIFFHAGYSLVNEMKNNRQDNFVVEDSYFDNKKIEIPSNQYTNVLNEVHENLDSYIGKEIVFTGYIYRINYLEKNQFVLARNMIINPASQTVVVGFLSEYDKINEFDNLSWVKVSGVIEKGNLDGEIPILKINSIEKTNKPKDEFVYPPEDAYVPTSASIY